MIDGRHKIRMTKKCTRQAEESKSKRPKFYKNIKNIEKEASANAVEY